MPRTPERLLHRDVGDQLSPELALVDPDAAERARLALPDLTPTESRIIQANEAARAEDAQAEAKALPEPEPVVAERSRRRLGRATLALIIVGAAAAAALALPRALDGRGSETSAERLVPTTTPAHPGTSTRGPSSSKRNAAKPKKVPPKARPRRTGSASSAERAPATRHAATPRARSRPAQKPRRRAHPRPGGSGAARAIPDFVWAPAKSVSGYRVEFRSGSSVVLRARTRGARLHVSAGQLRPGRYRWLVWGLNHAGSPVGSPVVDATVTVK